MNIKGVSQLQCEEIALVVLGEASIEKDGPTRLLLTTKRHPENKTRLVSIQTTDTNEQTKAVLLVIADGPRPSRHGCKASSCGEE